MRIELRTSPHDGSQPNKEVKLLVSGKFANFPVKSIEGDHSLIVFIVDERAKLSTHVFSFNLGDIKVSIENHIDIYAPKNRRSFNTMRIEPLNVEESLDSQYTARVEFKKCYSPSVGKFSYYEEKIPDFAQFSLNKVSHLHFTEE